MIRPSNKHGDHKRAKRACVHTPPRYLASAHHTSIPWCKPISASRESAIFSLMRRYRVILKRWEEGAVHEHSNIPYPDELHDWARAARGIDARRTRTSTPHNASGTNQVTRRVGFRSGIRCSCRRTGISRVWPPQEEAGDAAWAQRERPAETGQSHFVRVTAVIGPTLTLYRQTSHDLGGGLMRVLTKL